MTRLALRADGSVCLKRRTTLTTNPANPPWATDTRHVRGAAITAISSHVLDVRARITNGPDAFTIHGHAQRDSIAPLRDRIRAAVLNSGLTWPSRTITVEITPPGLAGCGLDLPITIAHARCFRRHPGRRGCVLLADLGLDGSLRPVRGMQRAVTAASRVGISIAVVAPADTAEAILAPRHRRRAASLCRYDQKRLMWDNMSYVITPALPAPLRLFAEILKRDGAQQLGSAALFANVVGFDVVEQRINDLSVVSGVPVARLQQIVDTGRQAFDPAAPKRPGQHVVSQALLKFFYGPTNQGDQLISYNLQYGTARLRSAAAVGKIENFVKIDSDETEQLWSRTEQHLPAAIRAALTRRIFQHPEHVAVIKDAIALHYARSLDVLDSAEQRWPQTLAQARAAYLADPGWLEHLFYLKHGFHAAGPTVHEEIVNDLLTKLTAQYQSGAAFRLRVVDVFEETRLMAASAGLEIIRPQRGEFLIGDMPAISIDSARQALGIPGGVPFGDATTVILPLSPTRLAALGRADTFHAVPASAVRFTNLLEVAMAHDYVFMRPGSGLEQFVSAQRQPTGSAKQ